MQRSSPVSLRFKKDGGAFHIVRQGREKGKKAAFAPLSAFFLRIRAVGCRAGIVT